MKRLDTRKVKSVIQKIILRRKNLWKIFRIENIEGTKEAINEKQAEELVNNMRRWLESSYKYADIIFKLFSWLLAIGVVQNLWLATRHGLFLIVLGVMFGAFLLQLTLRVLYFLPYTLNFILRKQNYLKEVLVAISFISITVPLILIFSVLPVVIKKTLFAIHCPSSQHELTRLPVDCPVRPRHR